MRKHGISATHSKDDLASPQQHRPSEGIKEASHDSVMAAGPGTRAYVDVITWKKF